MSKKNKPEPKKHFVLVIHDVKLTSTATLGNEPKKPEKLTEEEKKNGKVGK